jgi:hypothetical protein
MPYKNPTAVALAASLMELHANPTDDPDDDNMRLEDLSVKLARAVLVKHPAAVTLGRRGGKVTSEAKADAARENGTKGGRPPKPK